MLQLSQKNNLPINKIKINGISDNKKFKTTLLKEIYNHSAGDIFLLSDNIVKDNYLVRIEKDQNPKINKKSEQYKKYLRKANAEYISQVYKSYDKYINTNYKLI